MDITADRLGRLLLSAPFLFPPLVMAASLLREVRYAAAVRQKIAMTLTALVLASIGIGIALLINTDDDFRWCTKDHRDDPLCKHWGGE